MNTTDNDIPTRLGYLNINDDYFVNIRFGSNGLILEIPKELKEPNLYWSPKKETIGSLSFIPNKEEKVKENPSYDDFLVPRGRLRIDGHVIRIYENKNNELVFLIPQELKNHPNVIFR